MAARVTGRLRYYWSALRASLWFVPAALVLAAIGLALLMIELDVLTGPATHGELRFGMGAEGARSILATIAGSIITVAGVAFSITIVALSLTASQYSSRVLRNFMRDTTSQAVLGALVGTFAYCLVVLRTIRGGDEGLFIPALAITGGVALAFVAIGTFVYFIHHIATAIQASHIVANVAAETLEAVEHLFPDALGDGEDDRDAATEDPAGPWHVVTAAADGYLQRVDGERLLRCAAEHQVVVRLERGIGAFVVAGLPLAAVSGATPVEDRLAEAVRAAFVIDRFRTIDQDASYGVRQLVDVALKALSPGINDTTTAVMCVDWLGAILARIGSRRVPSRARLHDGALRVLAAGPTFASLLDQAVDQIRQHAAGNAAVLERQAKSLEALTRAIAAPSRRRCLREKIDLIGLTARRSIPLEADRVAIEQVVRRAGTDVLTC